MKKVANGTPKLKPAYLLNVTLENVRCFGPKQTLDLSDGEGQPRQWTIILGDNGTGKTTLLQSIVALSPTYESKYRNIIDPVEDELDLRYFLMGKTWRPIRNKKNEFYLEAKYLIGSKILEKKTGENVAVHIEGRKNEAGTEHSFEIIGDIPIFAYGASRRMGETQLSENSSQDSVISLFLENAPLINAEEWFLQTDYLALKESEAQEFHIKRRDKIKELLLQILPDIADIRIGDISQGTEKSTVEFKTPFGWISIRNLSLGYRTLISWMVDLGSRLFATYPHSKNPLKEPAIVLIDEIDLHLHPKWQRNLLDYISKIFINTQFIVTAHSPLIVQSAPDANIALLVREDDHILINNDLDVVRGWRIDQILTSDLFGLTSANSKYLDRLLEKRTKILSKNRLTNKDRQELKTLEAKISELPVGETLKEDRLMKLIEEATQYLPKDK